MLGAPWGSGRVAEVELGVRPCGGGALGSALGIDTLLFWLTGVIFASLLGYR